MSSSKQKWRRVANAVGMGSAIALGLEFSATEGCCALASCCGAAVLRKLGVNAQPELCAVTAFHREITVSAGHSFESARVLWASLGESVEDFDRSNSPANMLEQYPFHVAIRCRLGEAQGLLDLRPGQLNQRGHSIVGGWCWFEGAAWPDGSLHNGETHCIYQACPHPAHVPPGVLTWRNTFMEESMYELAQMALSVDVDLDRFSRLIKTHALLWPKPGSAMADAFGPTVIPDALKAWTA